MAVEAAREAVVRSGLPVADFGLLVHSSLWFQGRPLWPSASFVAHHALGAAVPAFDVRQQCNAGLGTVELAAGHLTSGTRGTAALLTTGDRFDPPAIDRWHTHGTAVYADGGTALVLSATTGFARVLTTTTVADNMFEEMNRGHGPLDTLPPSPHDVVSLVARNAEFAAEHDMGAVYQRLFATTALARQAALDELGLTLPDMAKVIDINSRAGVDDEQYCQYFGIAPRQSTWHIGRTVGHLGTGDHFATLDLLLRGKQLRRGDLVMLFGGGAGYTATTVILEILELPDW
jgi:3-oxoacyl-[acyl-carrier-protein] synthase-3